MTREGALPKVLRDTLAAPGGSCYRHCGRPVRTRTLTGPLPGTWRVRLCPAGVVSVSAYAEWSRRDPTSRVRAVLRRWTVPPSLVRDRDLRRATRHGPELGRPAERFLASVRPPRPLHVVYWRLYPFRGRDGVERRLFLCLRAGHRGPVFYAAPSATGGKCPVCARSGRASAGPQRGRRGKRAAPA